MSDRMWRVRADVVTHGEWYVEAESREAAYREFEAGLYGEEPENLIGQTDYDIVGPIVETDEFGEPIAESADAGTEKP